MNPALLAEKLADFRGILADIGRDIRAQGKTLSAIVVPSAETSELMEGGFGDDTDWTVKIPRGALPHPPRQGDRLQWDGAEWRVFAVQDHPAQPFIQLRCAGVEK